MSFGDDLRKERVRQTWDEFRSASKRYPWLYHVCLRDDDQDPSGLVPWMVSDQDDSAKESLELVLHQSDFQDMVGRHLCLPAFVHIGSHSWYALYSVCTEEADYADSLHEFVRLSKQALGDLPMALPHNADLTWLEILYATVDCEQEIVKLDDPDLSKGSVCVTWLPADVFTTSARAIELLSDQGRPTPDLTGPPDDVGCSERTADSKPDTEKKRGAVVPQNPDVARLAKKIKQDLPKGGNMLDIARDFTNGDEKRAQSLLRQLRGDRFKHLLE